MSYNKIDYKKNNPLEAFKQKHQLSYSQLSELLNMSSARLSNYILGVTYPSIETKQQIQNLTNGEVVIASWPESPRQKVGRPKGIGKALKYPTNT